MSGLLEYAQTSGNDWGRGHAGMHGDLQESVDSPEPRQQLVAFARLEAQMARFEADHQALIDEVRRQYVMPVDSSVEELFQRYRVLPQLLIEAGSYLRRYFGETVFALRSTSDDYGWQTLYVDAIWPGKPNDAMAAIDAFEDAWWIVNSHRSGSLTFTYRLV